MLIDAQGHTISTKKPRVTFTQPALAKMASMADDAFRALHLTVVCVKCGGTPTCNNHPGDAHWKMECACMERVLTNPEPRREKILS